MRAREAAAELLLARVPTRPWGSCSHVRRRGRGGAACARADEAVVELLLVRLLLGFLTPCCSELCGASALAAVRVRRAPVRPLAARPELDPSHHYPPWLSACDM